MNENMGSRARRRMVRACQRYAALSPWTSGIYVRIVERSRSHPYHPIFLILALNVLALIMSVEAFAEPISGILRTTRTLPPDTSTSFAPSAVGGAIAERAESGRRSGWSD